MGYRTRHLEIKFLASSHNSMNDDLDRVRWEWFKRDVEQLAQRCFGEKRKIGEYDISWEVYNGTHDDDREEFYLEVLNGQTAQ